MKYSLVIPNYNGRSLLEQNLGEILRHTETQDVILVDDASKDDSIAYVRSHFPKVKIIEKVINSGFATTVNLGVKAAHHELVLLLNTDAVPQKGFEQYVLSHFSHPHVFGVGCLDQSIEADGKVILRGRGTGKFARGFLLHARGEVEKTNTLWVSGGSSMVRKSIWEKLGGLDELYNPFYWEDIDISYRAQKSGYTVVFEPRSIVTHVHQQGSIKKHFSAQHIKAISYRNQFIFVWKNITDVQLLAEHILWLPVHLFTAILSGDWAFISGFTQALLRLRSILQQRAVVKASFKLSDRQILPVE